MHFTLKAKDESLCGKGLCFESDQARSSAQATVLLSPELISEGFTPLPVQKGAACAAALQLVQGAAEY